MIINPIIFGEAQASGLPYTEGSVTLSNSQSIYFDHNLNSTEIMVYFWADPGTVTSTSAVRVTCGICATGISRLISGYYQLKSDETHASPADKPLICWLGFASGATSLANFYATGNSVSYGTSTADTNITSNRFSVRNTSVRFTGTFHWIAIDISGKVEDKSES